MKKTFILYSIVSIILLALPILIGCSVAEPADTGSTASNPQYIENTKPFVFISDNISDFDHAFRHENGGADEINVTGLSGVLADDQHIIDSEAVSAIENAGSLTLPAYTQGDDVDWSGLHYFVNGDNRFRINVNGVYDKYDTDGSNGSSMAFYTNSVSPAVADELLKIYVYGNNSVGTQIYYDRIEYVIEDATNGSEDGGIEWWLMRNGTIASPAMILHSTGQLLVDASYGTFDDYDDAKLLKDSVKNGDVQLLVDAGIFKEKKDNDGKTIPNEYMLDVQKMSRLLAGGIYQNRDYVDALEARVTELEKQVDELTKGGAK